MIDAVPNSLCFFHHASKKKRSPSREAPARRRYEEPLKSSQPLPDVPRTHLIGALQRLQSRRKLTDPESSSGTTKVTIFGGWSVMRMTLCAPPLRCGSDPAERAQAERSE